MGKKGNKETVLNLILVADEPFMHRSKFVSVLLKSRVNRIRRS